MSSLATRHRSGPGLPLRECSDQPGRGRRAAIADRDYITDDTPQIRSGLRVGEGSLSESLAAYYLRAPDQNTES